MSDELDQSANCIDEIRQSRSSVRAESSNWPSIVVGNLRKFNQAFQFISEYLEQTTHPSNINLHRIRDHLRFFRQVVRVDVLDLEAQLARKNPVNRWISVASEARKLLNGPLEDTFDALEHFTTLLDTNTNLYRDKRSLVNLDKNTEILLQRRRKLRREFDSFLSQYKQVVRQLK